MKKTPSNQRIYKNSKTTQIELIDKKAFAIFILLSDKLHAFMNFDTTLNHDEDHTGD